MYYWQFCKIFFGAASNYKLRTESKLWSIFLNLEKFGCTKGSSGLENSPRRYTAPFPTVDQCFSVLGAQDVGQIKSAKSSNNNMEFIHFLAGSLMSNNSFSSLFIQVKTNPLQSLRVSSSYSHYYSNHPLTSPPPKYAHIYTHN